MAKYIKNAFGVNGDLVNVPDDTQVDGGISYNQGYPDPYQRDPATDPTAKRIERAKMNKLFNDVTSNIKEWQEQTFPDWISDDGNGTPFAYNEFAIVRYTDGNNYVSLVDSNIEEPTIGSNWQEFTAYLQSFGAEIATAAEIRIGTNNTKAISPLGYNLTTLGWGQTQTDVKSTKSPGVTYTNNTGRPIEIVVSVYHSGSNVRMDFYRNGDIIGNSRSGATNIGVSSVTSFIVPNGWTYKLEVALGSPAIEYWHEIA